MLCTALVLAAAFTAAGDATTQASPPVNSAKPAVSGTARVGSTLTSTSGSWTGATPMTFAYKWQSCDTAGNNCTTISGASSSTYVLQAADGGHTVRSQVTATNSDGSATSTSDPTATVQTLSAPNNTAAPAISGSTTVGSTLTTTNGTWSGATPLTYAYNWLRCDANGNGCASIGLHSDNQTYVLVSADQGHTVRVVVTATNPAGSAQATSQASGVVSAGGPINTVAPAISGTTAQGATLTATTGTWTSSTTISYAYAWQRCDANGGSCNAISGATAATYVLTASDAGHKIAVSVKATNSTGSNTVSSAAVGPVAAAPALPPGAVKLPSGAISVPASSVPDSDRLTIVSVKYSPSAIHGRAPVTLTVQVTDQNKYVISGALVYVLPVPSNWAAKTAEVQTAQDGTAAVKITPTSKAPKRGSLVLFVRVRTPQGNLLAGSSSRRLIQVRILAN